MTDLLKKIEAQMEQFCINVNAHANKGNKTAGVRARKASLELERLFKEYRKASLELERLFKEYRKASIEADKQ